LIAAAGVLLLAAGVALGAAGAGGSNTIYGCVGKHGSLTVLSHGTKCGRHRRAIAWNAQGPPGRDGSTGPPGVTGPAGPSFGDSTAASPTQAGICQPVPIAKLTISVAQPSRIFALITGSYYDNSSPLDIAVFDVELRDMGDTKTLAVLPAFSMPVASNTEVQLSTQGVLRTGSDPQTPGTTAAVVQPGTYLVKWLAWGAGQCVTSIHPQVAGTLTYMLLGNTP
jgi:hypothetical protein